MTQTAKKIMQRLLAKFKKESQDTGVQTNSYEEIKQEFEENLKNFQRRVEQAEQDYQSLYKEYDKMR